MPRHYVLGACTIVAALAMVACSASSETDSPADDQSSALSAGCVAVDLAQQAQRCDAAPPPAQPEGFRHEKMDDEPRHRGRDMFFRQGEPQWLLAKFAYGTLTNKLKDEDVDISVLESCGTTWKKLGRVRTSDDHHGKTSIDGFDDEEGRIVYEIPAAQRLPVGRHRVRLVVAADGSATELFIEVVPSGTKVAVIDIDGTINYGMAVEETFKIIGADSPVREGAVDALTALAQKGMRPFYLTARADLDTVRTREFIRANGLPDGVIHTTHLLTGLFATPATLFKTQDLQFTEQHGVVPAFGFGNQKSDVAAYENGGIPRDRRYYFQFDDPDYNGHRVESYVDLVPEFRALRSLCGAR